jgi:hypothetical protein
MLKKVNDAREYRFVHLDVVAGNVEVCNRVSSEVRTEEKCISPITPVSFSPLPPIRTSRPLPPSNVSWPVEPFGMMYHLCNFGLKVAVGDGP